MADEALECFQQSLQLGRGMGALAWQLRAEMSLVRLRICQGEAYEAELAEARACLGEVYVRFTEGFEFPDLQEAAELIGEAGRARQPNRQPQSFGDMVITDRGLTTEIAQRLLGDLTKVYKRSITCLVP